LKYKPETDIIMIIFAAENHAAVLNFEFFIARRISYKSHRSFSRAIIRIALLAVALSIAIMIISDAIVIGFQNEIKEKICAFAAHIQVGKLKSNFLLENDPVKLDPAFMNKIKSEVPDVSYIQPFATKAGIIKSENSIEGIVLKGIDKNFNWSFFRHEAFEGNQVTFNDSDASDNIIISHNIAERLNLKIGEQVAIYFIKDKVRARNFTIKGIYKTGIEDIDKQFVLCDLKQIAELNGWQPGEVGGYEIFLKNFDQLEKANDKVRELTDITLDTKTIVHRYPQIFDWLGLLDTNIQVILILMGIVATINMVTALLIMILERTQMIGIMKALGSRNWQLQKIFLINGMLLIGLGLIIGNCFGFGLMLLQKYFHIMKLSEESYYVSEVPVYFDWLQLTVINVCAFLVCSLALLLPGILVSRIRPVKAIRFE
jgi:lipoprotein-releasing system permease protein